MSSQIENITDDIKQLTNLIIYLSIQHEKEIPAAKLIFNLTSDIKTKMKNMISRHIINQNKQTAIHFTSLIDEELCHLRGVLSKEFSSKNMSLDIIDQLKEVIRKALNFRYNPLELNIRPKLKVIEGGKSGTIPARR